ncbi:MAG: DNA polymerase III subunit delta' [Burkholderiales bacterium]|nr:DNA polymerase III subunit delta' [Phycisphaerae bacterium]
MVTFKDILGQEAAINALRDAYIADRLPHALVFSGPVGVGKATTARALGALFLCENPKKDSPCCKCAACKLFDASSHPDFHVITKELIRYHDKTGKSKGIDLSINVIRPELLEKVAMKAAMNRGKVFVIEQAELMNAQAQNAMLKTLEEPAGRTLIILLTDQPGSILATVRSRSQVIRFAALSFDVVQEQLVARKIDKRTGDRAANVADGSLGLALKWIEDGVVYAADQLTSMLESAERGGDARGLPEWFKKSAEAYAQKQLERDELGSKDQATREALTLYLRLASEHFRKRMAQIRGDDPNALEAMCAAVDSVVLTESYIDSNVNVPLAMQQLAGALERIFSSSGKAMSLK